jgi:hypothetical protein
MQNLRLKKRFLRLLLRSGLLESATWICLRLEALVQRDVSLKRMFCSSLTEERNQS